MPSVQKPDPAPRSFTSVLGFVMALNTLIGMYAAGLTGIAVVIFAGPGFAQYLWMIRADTPVEPHLPYPWLATLVCGLLPVPLIRRRQWLLAGVAAIPFAVLPYVQLYRLYIAAKPTLFE